MKAGLVFIFFFRHCTSTLLTAECTTLSLAIAIKDMDRLTELMQGRTVAKAHCMSGGGAEPMKITHPIAHTM